MSDVGICCVRSWHLTQRVKIEDLASALQTLEEVVDRYDKKNAEVGEVELADDIK